jgi:hypothetical protein
MCSSINRHYILQLTIKTLRVCGVAGLIGFLLAAAIDQIGANRAVFQAPTTKISVPAVLVATFDRRQDRSDQSEQQTAKADMLGDSRPARGSTHFITEAPVTNVENTDLPALNGPMWTADRPGKAASGLAIRAAGAFEI